MASKAGRQVQEFTEDSMFIGRFIYDVLVYTLTKCGLPEISLPTTDCAENVYHRTDFVKIAGGSVLWVSLTMRDKWKRMFISRRNSSGYSNKNILEFLEKLAKCCGPNPTSSTQSLVKVLLALCNEIMMYFHLENIDIHFNNLTKLISAYIVGATGLNRNDPEKLEELFDNFDDISGYIDWINDFITKFAIPYGSRENVSNLFCERVREQFEDDLEKQADSLLISLNDLSAITEKRSEDVLKSFSIPSDSQSPEPRDLAKGSEIGAVGGKKSLGSLSTCTENVAEHVSENKQSSEISSEVGIEQDLEKTSIDVEETTHETQGAKTNRKKSKKVKGIGKEKGSGNLAESTSIPSDSKSLEPPKLATDSKVGAVGGKKSLGSLSTCTENVSEHLSKNKQCSEISSEVGTEQDLEKTSIDVEETTHETQGAKAKHEKDIGMKKGS